MPPEEQVNASDTEFPLKLRRPIVVTPKITPKIIDEEGKEVVRPDVLEAVVQLAQLGQMVKIRKSLEKVGESLEKEEFEGKLDPRPLDATDELQFITLIHDFPYTPWISAFFINNGPDTVRIAINRPYEQFELGAHETRTVSRAHAEERIGTIFYVCDPGETASIEVTGEY
ncbi:hypothetical protein ES708_25963 [subsurface metagenome]